MLFSIVAAPNYIPTYSYTPHFVYLFIHLGTIGLFPPFCCCDYAAINMGVQVTVLSFLFMDVLNSGAPEGQMRAGWVNMGALEPSYLLSSLNACWLFLLPLLKREAVCFGNSTQRSTQSLAVDT